MQIVLISLICCVVSISAAVLRTRRSTSSSDFIEEPASTVAARNASVTLQCLSSSSGSVDYYWKYNGMYIDFENNGGQYSVENGGKSLKIMHVMPITEGHYQCVSRTTSGARISRAAHVEIAYIRVVGGTSQGPTVTAARGSYALLNPTAVQSHPKPVFTWRKYLNDEWKEISSMPDHYVSDGGDLFLPAIKSSGTYQVTVRNHLLENNQEYQLRSVMVNVTGSITDGECPEKDLVLLSPVQNITVNVGDSSATFDCLVASKRCWSSPSVRWLLDNGGVENSHQLSIQNPTTGDAKRYTCEATNAGVTQKYFFWLFVRELPSWSMLPLKFVTLSKDATISGGTYTGASEVEWYVDGDLVQSARDYFEVNPEKNLQVKRLSKLHEGMYQLFLKNEAGVRSFSFEVSVMGGCGGKLYGDKGDLNVTSIGSSTQAIECGWVLQLPYSGQYNFNMKYSKFNGATGDCTNTRLSLMQKSRLPVGESWLYCIWDGTPKPIPALNGPYIILQATLKPEYFNGDGGFSLSYERKNTAPPTTEPSTKELSTQPASVTSELQPTTESGKLGAQKKEDDLPVWIVGLVSGLGAVLIILAFVMYVIWRRRHSGSVPEMEANGKVQARKNPYNHVSIKPMGSPSVKPILGKGVSETSFGDPDVPVARIAVSRGDRPTLSQSYSDPFNQGDVPIYSVCDTPDYQNVSDALPNGGTTSNNGLANDSGDIYYNSMVQEYETPYESSNDATANRNSASYDYPYESNAYKRPGLTNSGFQGNDEYESSPDESTFEQAEYETPYESSRVGAQQYSQPHQGEQHYAKQNMEPYEPALYEPLEHQSYNVAGQQPVPGDDKYADLTNVVPKNNDYQSFAANYSHHNEGQVYDMPEESSQDVESNYQALQL